MVKSFAVKEAIMIRHFVLSRSIYERIAIKREDGMDIFCWQTLYAENANAKGVLYPDIHRTVSIHRFDVVLSRVVRGITVPEI